MKKLTKDEKLFLRIAMVNMSNLALGNTVFRDSLTPLKMSNGDIFRKGKEIEEKLGVWE